jgi:hypothetical protein
LGYEPAASGREKEADHPAAPRRRPGALALALKTTDARFAAEVGTGTTPAAPVPVSDRCDTGTRLAGSITIASPPAMRCGSGLKAIDAHTPGREHDICARRFGGATVHESVSVDDSGAEKE